MIKNGRSKRQKLSAGKPRVSLVNDNRKKANANLSNNYAFMLQMYVLSRDERIRKKRLKPIAKLASAKKPFRFSLLNSSLIVNIIKPFISKVSNVKSRIYTAIEISYQSLIG